MIDWRDVCEKCHRVMAMPDDGSPPEHLCLHDPVPWYDLLIHSPARSRIRDSCLDRGALIRTEVPLEDLAGDDPSQMGPFAPGEPPRPRLVGDLVLWSRSELRTLGLSRPAILRLENWLAEHDLALNQPNPVFLKNFLRAQLLARYEGLPLERRTYRLNAIPSGVRALRDELDRIAWNANSGLLPRSAPADERTVYIGVPEVGVPEITIDASDDEIIEVHAQSSFRLRRLILSENVAEAVEIADIRIGRQSFLNSPVPGSFFASDALDEEFLHADVQTGETITVRVRNVSARPIVFRMVLVAAVQAPLSYSPAYAPPPPTLPGAHPLLGAIPSAFTGLTSPFGPWRWWP